SRDSSVAVDEKNKRVYAIASDRAFSYSLATGQKNWEAGGAKYCNLTGQAAPTAIIVEQECFDTDKAVIVSLDLDNGHDKSRGKYNVPGSSSPRVHVLSADPAVAMINPGSASARGNVIGFDGTGKPGAQIPVSQPSGKLAEYSAAYDNIPSYLFN